MERMGSAQTVYQHSTLYPFSAYKPKYKDTNCGKSVNFSMETCSAPRLQLHLRKKGKGGHLCNERVIVHCFVIAQT